MSSSVDGIDSWNPPNLGIPGAPTQPAGTEEGEWILPDFSGLHGVGVTEFVNPSPHNQELRKAFERGLDEGRREGAAQAEEKLRSAVQALRQITESLAASRNQRLRDLEANICALAVAVARKIVLRELAEPDAVGSLVQQALEQVDLDDSIEVRLHPGDLNLIRADLKREIAEAAHEIRWTADPSLERGSFLLEGSRRIVDGRVDEALRVLYERLAHE